MNSTTVRVVTFTLLATSIGLSGASVRAGAQGNQSASATVSSTLQLDPLALNMDGMKKNRLGYMPINLKLTTVKPAEVTKEPTYTGKPYYAEFHLGNGPKSLYVLAIDVPTTGDYKLYVDKNQDGDLTASGDGAWSKENAKPDRVVYGINFYTLRASWGTASNETGSGDYGLGFYGFPGDTPRLFMMRSAARTGTLTVGGSSHKVLLVENDGDALYSKPITTDDKGKPVGDIKTRPVWLAVDMKDDGKFEIVDVRIPFKLGNSNYEAQVAEDGSSISLKPTTKAIPDLEPKAPPLLAAGAKAPNFMAEGHDGRTVQLSDYKGKVLILDFWATWCGPCQKSMPHLEKVWRAVKAKNVAVLGLCVWDEKKAYEAWVPAHKTQYTFPLAYDPAGTKNDASIAYKLFQVSGIPTTYIIGKDGKVVDAIVGYDDGDTRVEAALKKVGIIIPTQTASAQK